MLQRIGEALSSPLSSPLFGKRGPRQDAVQSSSTDGQGSPTTGGGGGGGSGVDMGARRRSLRSGKVADTVEGSSEYFPGVKMNMVGEGGEDLSGTSQVSSPKGTRAKTSLRGGKTGDVVGAEGPPPGSPTSQPVSSPKVVRGRASLRHGKAGDDGDAAAIEAVTSGSPRGTQTKASPKSKAKTSLRLGRLGGAGDESGSESTPSSPRTMSSPKSKAKLSLRHGRLSDADTTSAAAAEAAALASSPRTTAAAAQALRKSLRRRTSKGLMPSVDEVSSMSQVDPEKVIARAERYEDLDAMMFQSIGSLDRGHTASRGDLNWDELKQ